MQFKGEPIWVEIPDDRTLHQDGCNDTRNGKGFIHCINNMLAGAKVQICFVLVGNDKFRNPIKKHLDGMGIVSQFMLYKNIQKKVAVMGVVSNLLR